VLSAGFDGDFLFRMAGARGIFPGARRSSRPLPFLVTRGRGQRGPHRNGAGETSGGSFTERRRRFSLCQSTGGRESVDTQAEFLPKERRANRLDEKKSFVSRFHFHVDAGSIYTRFFRGGSWRKKENASTGRGELCWMYVCFVARFRFQGSAKKMARATRRLPYFGDRPLVCS